MESGDASGASQFHQAEALYRSVHRYLARYFSPPKNRDEEALVEAVRDLLLSLKLACAKRRVRATVRITIQIDAKLVELFARRMGKLDG